MSRQELQDKLTTLLGGRAAEMLVFEDISTGAADDLSKATDIARSMVTRYGMTKTLGPIAYECEPAQFLSGYPINAYSDPHRFSEETSYQIDCAVKELVNNALERALKILETHIGILKHSAQQLLTKETLTQDELISIKVSLDQKNDELLANADNSPAAGVDQEISNPHVDASCGTSSIR
jgi:cell division protease FtsH